MFDSGLNLLEEIWTWSLLGVKGFLDIIPLLMLVKGPSFSNGLWKNSGPRKDVTCVKLSMLGSLSRDDAHQSVAMLPTTSDLFSSRDHTDRHCWNWSSRSRFACSTSCISRSLDSLKILNCRWTLSLSNKDHIKHSLLKFYKSLHFYAYSNQ